MPVPVPDIPAVETAIVDRTHAFREKHALAPRGNNRDSRESLSPRGSSGSWPVHRRFASVMGFFEEQLPSPISSIMMCGATVSGSTHRP